jgi:hypothetical protein
MTVLRGSRASLLREQARRELVERAVETTDGREYLEILRSVAPEDWDGVWAELVLRVGVPVVPEHVAHRRAKAQALAQEDARRRAGSSPEGA